MSFLNLFNWLVPPSCIYCLQLGTYICSSCQGFFLENYQKQLDCNGCLVTVGFYYNAGLEHAWKLIKYEGYYTIAEYLGELLAKRLANSELLRDSPVFVPIPLHQQKLRTRGFNQVEKLIRGMNSDLQVVNLLVRERYTETQVGKNKQQREHNLADAFALNPAAQIPLEAKIILVDDIYTTGTTLAECSTVLRAGGYKNISGLVFAKG